MTETLFDTMRKAFVPFNSASDVKKNPEWDIVKMHLGDYGYFRTSQIQEIVDYLEKKALMISVGVDSLTPTDKFALKILVDSMNERGYDIKF